MIVTRESKVILDDQEYLLEVGDRIFLEQDEIPEFDEDEEDIWPEGEEAINKYELEDIIYGLENWSELRPNDSRIRAMKYAVWMDEVCCVDG
ncbi:MAG: hypothetical protein GF411_02775 [Candidatus Lokiarchaeota archaeon]|nr:hypothetical protein [Candidatus Lokiarchaeota archaeon]